MVAVAIPSEAAADGDEKRTRTAQLYADSDKLGQYALVGINATVTLSMPWELEINKDKKQQIEIWVNVTLGQGINDFQLISADVVAFKGAAEVHRETISFDEGKGTSFHATKSIFSALGENGPNTLKVQLNWKAHMGSDISGSGGNDKLDFGEVGSYQPKDSGSALSDYAIYITIGIVVAIGAIFAVLLIRKRGR